MKKTQHPIIMLREASVRSSIYGKNIDYIDILRELEEFRRLYDLTDSLDDAEDAYALCYAVIHIFELMYLAGSLEKKRDESDNYVKGLSGRIVEIYAELGEFLEPIEIDGIEILSWESTNLKGSKIVKLLREAEHMYDGAKAIKESLETLTEPE